MKRQPKADWFEVEKNGERYSKARYLGQAVAVYWRPGFFTSDVDGCGHNSNHISLRAAKVACERAVERHIKIQERWKR